MSSSERWSEEEIQIILDMRKVGSSPTESSELLHTQGYERTPGAIAKKLTTLSVYNPSNPSETYDEYNEYNYPTPEQIKLTKGKKLLALCCMHIGEKNANLKLLQEYIDYAKKEKARIAILGDWIDNGMVFGTKHVGSIWDNRFNPQHQMDIAVKMFKPVRNQIDVVIAGNHGGRTQKLTSIDPERWIAKALDVPFCPPLYNYMFDGKRLVLAHGTGGGPMSDYDKIMRGHDNIDGIIVGHTHQLEQKIVRRMDNGKPKEVHLFRAGTFLDMPRYGIEALYPPSPVGAPIIWVGENGRIKAHLGL